MTDRVERPASPEAAAADPAAGPPLRRPRGRDRHTAPPTTEFALPGAVREREPQPPVATPPTATPPAAEPAPLVRRETPPPVVVREREPFADDELAVRDEGDAGRGDGGVELSLPLPTGLRTWFETRRDAWTQVDSAAAVITGVTLLLTLSLLFPGSLYLNDLIGQANASGRGFWGHVLGADGTPFAPLPRALEWIQSRWFTLEYAPAASVSLLVRLALSIAFWRLLRRLFGPRPAILLPFAVLLLTPALLPSTLWIHRSVTVLAATVAIVWALDATVRWALYRRTADLVVVGVATAVGLACSEKAAVLPFVLLAVGAAVFLGAPAQAGGRGRRGAGQGHPPFQAVPAAAGVSAAVLALFLLIYLVGPDDQGPRGLPSPLGVIRVAFDAVAGSIVPMLFGGPWRWSYPAPFAGTPDVPLVLAVLCTGAVLAGLVLVARRAPVRAGRAVLVAAGFVLPSAVVVASGRGDLSWAELGDATGLWADVVPGLLLAATLAALPWRLGAEATPAGIAAGTGRLLPLPPAAASLQVTETVDGRAVPVPAAVLTDRGDPDDGAFLVTPAMLGAALVVVLAAGSATFGAWSYAQRWWDNPTNRWLTAVRNDLAGAEPYPRIVATPLPEWVLPATMNDQFPTDAALLRMIRPDVRLNDADGPARLVNDAGLLVPPLPLIVAASKQGAVCTVVIPGGAEGARVGLSKATPVQPGMQLDVGVLITRPTTIEVTVERPDGSLTKLPRQTADELPKGPHTVRYAVPPGVSVKAVRVSTPAAGSGCITLAQAWVPTA